MTNLKLSSRMRRFVVGCVKRFIPYRVVSFFDKRQRERNSFRLVIGSQKLVIDRRKRDMAGVVPAIYWDGVDNFGDTIGPYLISKITGKAVLNVIDSRRPGMMTVGSILQLVDRRGVVVWGSGLIEKPSRKLLAKIKNSSQRY